jgi:hypothetical protein
MANNPNGGGAAQRAALTGAQGMVKVEFHGLTAGTKPYYGWGSKTTYHFNNGKRKFGFVDARDLYTQDRAKPGLLQIQYPQAPGGYLFTLVEEEKPAEVEPVTAEELAKPKGKGKKAKSEKAEVEPAGGEQKPESGEGDEPEQKPAGGDDSASGDNNGKQEEDPAAVAPTDVNATDGAVKKAAELGVDLTTIGGTGQDGTITVKDVLAAAKGKEDKKEA